MQKKYLIISLVILVCIALIAGVMLFSTPEGNGSSGGIISGAGARELYENNESVILLDVRNQDEYDMHHIEGSILIPYTELESRLSELPNKDAIIIVFCRAGRRSAIAASILVDYGYRNVYDMQEIANWDS